MRSSSTEMPPQSTSGSPATDLGIVDIAVSPVEKYREFLATKGLRMTRERAIFVEEVFSSHEHFDAEQLIQRLAARQDSRRVSRSTIYRHLRQLEEAGLIRKVARQDEKDVYEHDYGYPQHDHFICNKCGELIEFQNAAISELVEQIAREYGFRMEGHRMEVHGLCRNCSRPPTTRPKKLNLL
ncbi:MAG: Fur family transcriptional regulator [Planctomycetaceae bacterium]